jgi:membrane protein DedA with SNARE-associated domain/membrane-associated phospholipid phosphatase
MIDTVARHILGLHGIAALAIVFVVPLLESSAFVGFVFPGEIAVILGGVLAFEHRVSLPAVLVAAILGAVIGDTAGYWFGRRYGRGVLSGRLGRLIIRREHVDRAERYLARRGGWAVFLGRFTAALRVMIPGLAGMARMPYRTFAVANIAGGTLWATAMVFIGYLAGASWQRAEHWASRIGLALLAVIVLGFLARLVVRAVGRRTDRARELADRLAATRPARWARRRYPTQAGWLRRRVDPGTRTGLALTATVLLAGLLAWTFGGLVQDVAAGEGIARFDPQIHAFAVAHRTGWLTVILANATWLGSNWLLVPILAVATAYLLLRRGDRRAAIAVGVTYLGTIALYALAKPLVDRPRPPAADLIGHATGPSFPSGHAAQALAAWTVLGVVLTTGRTRRTRVAALAVAALLVLVVGTSRVYLGAHWLTDVLAGYALTGTWLAVLVALWLPRRHVDRDPPPGQAADRQSRGTVNRKGHTSEPTGFGATPRRLGPTRAARCVELTAMPARWRAQWSRGTRRVPLRRGRLSQRPGLRRGEGGLPSAT